MSLSLSLRTPELLTPAFRMELEQLVAGLQTQFDRELPAPIHLVNGVLMPLTLSLRTPELLQPAEREELEQMLATLQAAFNANPVTSIVTPPVTRGTVTILAGQLTGTTTIPAVDLSRSRLRWIGGDAGAYPAYLELASTRVTATSAVVLVGNQVLTFEVTQYAPGVIKSRQAGLAPMAGNLSLTIPIAAVDPDRTEIDLLGWTATPAGPYDVRATLADRVSLIVSSQSNASTITAAWQVMEFN